MEQKKFNKYYILRDPLIQKFIQLMMIDGKKSKSETILINTLKYIKIQTQKSPIEVLLGAIQNVKPYANIKRLRSYRRKKPTIIPVPLSEQKSISLAIKWIISSSRSKAKQPMYINLGNELIDAYNNNTTCQSIQKKQAIHKEVLQNKLSINFRWF